MTIARDKYYSWFNQDYMETKIGMAYVSRLYVFTEWTMDCPKYNQTNKVNPHILGIKVDLCMYSLELNLVSSKYFHYEV